MNEKIDIIRLLYAIKYHDKGLTTTDYIVGTIWDSDRLSLYRFKNKSINTRLLSTKEALDSLGFAKNYINAHIIEYDNDYSDTLVSRVRINNK